MRAGSKSIGGSFLILMSITDKKSLEAYIDSSISQIAGNESLFGFQAEIFVVGAAVVEFTAHLNLN